MSRRVTDGIPAYQLHKRSGHARCEIDGREYWLGPHGTPESRERYDRLIAEWLGNGRRLPPPCEAVADCTVNGLIIAYWRWAEVEYSRDGRPTREFQNLASPFRALRKLYGCSPAAEYGPRGLKAVRQLLIDRGLSRVYVNDSINRIKRLFKWAVAEELIPPSTWHRLRAVAGLRRGKGGRETDKVRPVPESTIDAVRPHVARQIWGLIQLQLWTGMRPGEAVSIRARDIDTSGKLWEIRPSEHKTAHFGIDRIILVGPRGQEVLREFLSRDLDAFLFDPREAMAERNARWRAARKTKVSPSQRSRGKKHPERAPQSHYSVDSYRRAIHRACNLAFPAPTELSSTQLTEWRNEHQWSPNQLRHNCATRLRREHGVEIARIILGHTSAATTEIYAEMDLMKAKAIMADAG